MSDSIEIDFQYTVEDINNSVRRTNVLLRSANAVRLSIRDIQGLLKDPNLAKFMWTLIQLSRTYNSLRRLYKLIIAETNKAAAVIGYIREPPLPEVPAPPMLTFPDFQVRVDAFRENIPIGLDGIDLSDLPEKSSIMLQAILEEDAEQTVLDAKEILSDRILHPEESTGTLETSIGWQPEVFGTRLYASAFYAWWVETGHRTRGGGYFPGHWYMTDAVTRAKLRLPDKIKLELNGLIYSDL